MLAQGAALGAGAAVGSTMVHGAMGMMGGGSDRHRDEGGMQQQGGQNQAMDQASPYGAQGGAMAQQNQQMQNPCAYQLQDFLNCTQQQSDLSLCTAFNDVYKQCKLNNGMQ